MGNVKVNEVEQVGCAVFNCNIVEELKKKNDSYEKLNDDFDKVTNQLESIQEITEKKNPDKGSVEAVAVESIKVTSENNILRNELDKIKNEKGTVTKQLEENKILLEKTQEEFTTFKTKYDYDKEINEKRAELANVEKELKLRSIDLNKVNKNIIKYKDIFKRDYEDANKARNYFNDYLTKTKLLRMQEKRLKSNIRRLSRLDVKLRKKEIRLNKSRGVKLKEVFLKAEVKNPGLVKYVRTQLKKGFDYEVIEKHLLKYGFEMDIIKNTMQALR